MSRLVLVLAQLALVCCATLAQASPIIYTEQATGSGSLGPSVFSNALVTITFTGDTINVQQLPFGFSNGVGTSTVNISGIGTAVFTNTMQVFVGPQNNGPLPPAAGIAQNYGPIGDVLITVNPVFASYDLSTPIGPITGPPSFDASIPITPTNLGDFSLTSAGNSTFTATTGVAPVPEPGSGTLLAFGSLAIFSYCRLRTRADA
jgi:hypothetical protein